MSKHKTRPVQDSERDWFVARERGNQVRYQDRVTGRMTGWCASPAFLARQATMTRLAQSKRLPVIHTADSLGAYTVADIRTAGKNVLGLTFKSKARKADMVAAYLAEQRDRLA